ncbi:zinc-dependent alcohol dehydrogenase family protein [Amycolatopsis antarctica]|uniref:zinc-dependent alcohol dehydrogenase family protein n=1 Tax=Amycolatopsis antarctica TaxID=1854586 RepID=UPI00196A5EB9|nr:NAD(P)-dependent alcohol dehydrogenase [Amycolatopsis antarctica]
MRYHHLPSFTGADALRVAERDEPAPGPGQILVRMRAWSVNHRDLLIASGRYGRGMRANVVPLSDGAGEVVATGQGTTRWTTGDRVLSVFMPNWQSGPIDERSAAGALGGPVDGVLAEYVVFDEDAVVSAPAHLDMPEAATLPCAAVTAWHALVTHGGLAPGQQVLALGSGGVSVFAVQLAVAGGARVTVTSGDDRKLERLCGLGAADGVNYRRVPEWGRTIHGRSGGVDHVLEVGGAGTLRQSLAAVRTGGRVSVIGVLADGAGISVPHLLWKAVTVQGLSVGSRAVFEELNRAIVRHAIHPIVDRVFPFGEAAEAYRHLGTGKHFGKVVIVAD